MWDEAGGTCHGIVSPRVHTLTHNAGSMLGEPHRLWPNISPVQGRTSDRTVNTRSHTNAELMMAQHL